MARELLAPGEFIEVYVDTPLDVCIERDPKGLYRKAQAGEIQNFTGLDSPYEEPEEAELTVETVGVTPEELATRIVDYLRDRGYVP
jgi:bifunctional enzyme CysN/CysC